MKWLILILLIIGPGNLMISSKQKYPEKSHDKFAQPLLDLKPPLDELNSNLEELSKNLDKL